MGEVLSQSEIDNLLKQLSSGELDVDEIKNKDEKTVKNYDFARPAKFSKEHLRTLEIIFEHYARLLSTNLPAYLRLPVQVEVMNSEAVIYSEFSNALSNPVLLGVVDFEPLDGNVVIELGTNLGFAIIDMKKDTTAEQPRYLVFFKSRDADAITAAFQEFASRKMDRDEKPSIRERLAQAREQAAQKVEHRTLDREKARVKERGVEL